MQMLDSWWKALEPFFVYVSYCFPQPIQTPVCRPFWTWLIIGSFAFSALTVLIVIWKIVSFKLKLAAALRAQEERDRMPDDETMSRVRWAGDKAYSGELDGEEIERRVREAVNQRRLEEAAKRDKSNIVCTEKTHSYRSETGIQG